MFKRPTVKETDEDLIKQNNELLKSKGTEIAADDTGVWAADNDVKQLKTFGIVGEVVEKGIGDGVQLTEVLNVSDGFPTVFRVDLNSKLIYNANKKQSIFSQKLQGNQFCGVKQEIIEAIPVLPQINDDIHQENLEKMKTMTVEEIIEEKKFLEQNINPDLLNFLKKRAAAKNTAPKTSIENISAQSYDLSNIKENLLKTVNEEFLEMDKIEPEKLEWIGDIPDASCLQPGETYSARFNFIGDLQPFKMEIDVRMSLHHHGDEPDRPGYTIQELYQLSRSAVLQQRILALNTLANIIRKTKMGYYDSCFDGALLKKLVDSNLFFLLRFSMDDKTTTAAAVNCLHELFVSRSDEVCLDRLQNFALDNQEPFFYISIETGDETKENELKDDQIISQDLVRGVLRTDLLVRFSYILEVYELDPITVSKIFDIFIRVARHSPDTCQVVLQSNILSHVVLNLNSNQACHNGVKLLRVLGSSSIEILREISGKIDFRLIMCIIDMDEPLFKLKLECLALWRLFLRNNIFTDMFQNFTPCLGRLLSFYAAKVDIAHGRFDFELFSGIVSLLNAVLLTKNDIDPSYELALQICFEKWMIQLVANNGKMNYSVAKALATVLRFFVIKYNINVTKSDLVFLSKISQVLNNFLDISKIICDALIQYSHIICFKNVARDPDNLPSLCSVYRNGENYLKTVHDQSLWPFIEPFAEYLLKISGISKDFEKPLARLKESLENFSEKFWSHSEISSWFSRYELGVLITTLKIKKKFFDSDLLRFGFRLIPYFRTDDDRVLSVLEILSHPYVSKVFQTHLSKMLTHTHYHLCENISKHWMYEPISVATQETLQCLTTILENCPDLLSNVSPSLRFCHICLVLLNGENIFVPDIRKNLEICFKDVIDNIDKLELTKITISDKSFYELYRDLVIEFASCSYGDQLFAKIVTLPLCQRFDVSYRKLMWSEMMHALRVITLPITETFVSVEAFTNPVETDESLLVLYLNAVSSSVLTEHRNGFLYAVAVENLRKYLKLPYKEENVSLFLLRKISGIKDEQLRNYLLLN